MVELWNLAVPSLLLTAGAEFRFLAGVSAVNYFSSVVSGQKTERVNHPYYYITDPS